MERRVRRFETASARAVSTLKKLKTLSTDRDTSTVQQPTIKTPEFDLYIVKHFFEAEMCREIVNDMRRSTVEPALTYGKGEATVDQQVRRVSRITPSSDTILYVARRLEAHRLMLEQHFHIELGAYEEPQFLRYCVGDFFVAHQDGNTGLINLESDRTRRISITLFLNDQSAPERDDNDSYSGGWLTFSDWRTGARQEVSGEAGMLIAFRSETTHEVTPIVHGERYAIVTWFSLRT